MGPQGVAYNVITLHQQCYSHLHPMVPSPHTHTHTHHTLTDGAHTHRAHTHTDRSQEAERCYRKALSIKPDHINANTNMGHLCRLQERWEEASRHYQTALQRRPNNTVLRYYLGLVHKRMGGAENLQVSACITTIVIFSDSNLPLVRP